MVSPKRQPQPQLRPQPLLGKKRLENALRLALVWGALTLGMQFFLHLDLAPSASSRPDKHAAITEACDPDAIPWPADVKVSSAHGGVYKVPDSRRHVHRLLAARVRGGALANGLTPREVACYEGVFKAAREETSIMVTQSRGVKEKRTNMFPPKEPWGKHNRVDGNGTIVVSGHPVFSGNAAVFSQQSGFRIPVLDPRRAGIAIDCADRASRFLNDAGIEHSLAYGGVLGLAVFRGMMPWDHDLDFVVPTESFERLREVSSNKAWTDRLEAARLGLITDECGGGPGVRFYCNAVNFTSAPVCEDDASFADSAGKPCSAWVGVGCDDQRAPCANDDPTADEEGNFACSDWYDAHPEDCGVSDNAGFSASVQCCACGGGTVFSPAEMAAVRQHCPSACEQGNCTTARPAQATFVDASTVRSSRPTSSVDVTTHRDMCVEERLPGYNVFFIDVFMHLTRANLRTLGYLPAVSATLDHTCREHRNRSECRRTSVMAPPDVRAVAVRTYGADILGFVSIDLKFNSFKSWTNLTSSSAAEHGPIDLGPIRLTNFTPLQTEATEPSGRLECVRVQRGPTCLHAGPTGRPYGSPLDPGSHAFARQREARHHTEGKWTDFDLLTEINWTQTELGVGRNRPALPVPRIAAVLTVLRSVLDAGIPHDLVEFGAGVGSLTVFVLRLLELYNSPQDLFTFDCWDNCSRLENSTLDAGVPRGAVDAGDAPGDADVEAAAAAIATADAAPPFSSYNLSVENYYLWRKWQPDRGRWPWSLSKFTGAIGYAVPEAKRPIAVPGYFRAVPEGKIPATVSFALVDVASTQSQLDALAIIAPRLAPGGVAVILGYPVSTSTLDRYGEADTKDLVFAVNDGFYTFKREPLATVARDPRVVRLFG